MTSLRECRSCDNRLSLIEAVYYPETEETTLAAVALKHAGTWDE
jgi:hypothetical protein